jgi:hypothetical protein
VLISSAPPEYFAALGIDAVDGRLLTSADAPGSSPRPAVVSASLEEALGGPAAALGATLTVRSARYQVVGVVGDLACGSLRVPRCARVFTAAANDLNAQHAPQIGLSVTLKTNQNAAGLAVPVRQVATRLFPHAVLLDVRTGRDLVGLDLGEARMGAWFFSGFGLIALALGLAGLFGLVAYFAESRRREFGVRLALGATSRSVMGHIVGAGLWPVLGGVLAGLVIAAGLARSVDAFLVGVGRFDPASYGMGALLLLAGAGAAGLLGAWRVRRLSPMDALRVS